jgi:SAM-dependent methyltransferase
LTRRRKKTVKGSLKKLVPRFLRAGVKRYVQRISTESLAAAAAGWESSVRALEARVSEDDVRSQQLLAILEHEGAIPPPPPKHLQVRVVGGYVPQFVESGYAVCEDLQAVLRTAGKTLADFPAILDFGCGCGRIIRAMKSVVPSADLYGTDLDAEAIAWLDSHYGRFGQFRVAPHLPPLPFERGTFDLVVGLSVFTHLPEEMQFSWLDELGRITRPGGYLILSTHGEEHYGSFEGDAAKAMRETGFFYSDFGFNYGASVRLPDFYQTSFHTHAYVRREWGKRFEVLDIQTLRLQNHQDTILLRKPECE